MSDKVPDWAVEMAEQIDIAYSTPVSNVREAIAAALLSAYRRGVEIGAKLHEDEAATFDRLAIEELSVSEKMRFDASAAAHREAAAAIRRIGEAE